MANSYDSSGTKDGFESLKKILSSCDDSNVLIPSDLWFLILSSQLIKLRSTIPNTVRGNIQFQIQGINSQKNFYLVLNGATSAAFLGTIGREETACLIEANEHEVEQIIYSKEADPLTLKISGERLIFVRYLEHAFDFENQREAA